MISFRLPGASALNPSKPDAQAQVAAWRARGSPPSSGGFAELWQRNIIRIAEGGGPAATSVGPAPPASPPTPTASSRIGAPLQKKIRKGRAGAVTGTTAKLGGTQVSRPGASVLG